MGNQQQIIEVERIVNLAVAFGWKKILEETDGDTVKITLEKKVSPAAQFG